MSPWLARALIRVAGLLSIGSGLVGGLIWLRDIEDRSDGDSLRWGVFHNPFLQFPIFDHLFVETSMWILLACCAAAGSGGILLLFPKRLGVSLVVWQARVSIILNVVTAFYIVPMMFFFAGLPMWLLNTRDALMLRLGAIAVDLVLWGFLGSRVVKAYFESEPKSVAGAFPVITKEPHASAG